MRYLIGALSAMDYEHRRKVCRETWAVACPSIDVVFMCGDPSRSVPERNGDVLWLPVDDTYNCLPQKTRAFCRWALTLDDWDYLIKTDDDAMIVLDRLAAYQPPGDYFGNERKPGVRYGSGACYGLSRRAAAIVAERLTHRTGAEDRLVGDVLAQAGIPLHKDQRFRPWCRNRLDYPSPANDIIATHIGGGERRWLECGERIFREIAAGFTR